MKDFKKRGGDRGGFGGRGGKPSFGGGYDRKPSFAKKSWGGTRANDATMHKAVCSECGKGCEVPFRPTGGKPVYCNACFNPAGGSFRENNRSNDRFPKKDFAPRSAYTPRPEVVASTNNNDVVLKQFETLNIKIDRLVNAIETLVQTTKEVTPKEVPQKKAVAVKEVKKAVKKVVKKATKK